MAGMVGTQPSRYYGGVIVAVTAPYVTVRVSDDLDQEGRLVEIQAWGTGAVNDKVTLLGLPTGRVIVMRS